MNAEEVERYYLERALEESRPRSRQRPPLHRRVNRKVSRAFLAYAYVLVLATVLVAASEPASWPHVAGTFWFVCAAVGTLLGWPKRVEPPSKSHPAMNKAGLLIGYSLTRKALHHRSAESFKKNAKIGG